MEKVEEKRTLSQDETSLINTCAFLSAFMYLDTQEESYTGRTLKELITDDDFRSKANIASLFAIQDAILSNPNLGDITILSQSKIDNEHIPEAAPYSGFGPDLVIANAFDLGNGDICVAYRGTGAGKWIDNGEAFGKEHTVMQEAAARYFDYVYEKYGKQGDKSIYVTGHSKGGNEAQYVCMTAEHNYDIKHCYEFDGQGFSPEAIERFKKINGGNRIYEMQIDKITAINGKNDFVSTLGIPVAKPEKTYYIETVNSALNIGGYHDIFYMFNQESPDRINFKYDEFGDAISVDQGNLGKCAANLSKSVMKLDSNDRYACSVTMMAIIERISNGGYGTGEVKDASVGHKITFLSKGIPVISNATFDKSTFDSVYGLCHNLIKEGVQEKNLGKILGAVGIGALYGAYYVVGMPLSKIINSISSLVNAAINGIKELGQKVKEYIDIVKSHFDNVQDTIMQEYLERVGKAYGYDTKDKSKDKDLGNGYNERKSALETGVPELAVVIGPSSIEQYLYQQSQSLSGNKTHKMVNSTELASELSKIYGNGPTYEEIQKKAIHLAEHKAIECIKRGESVMLFLPDMYEPKFREQVNADLSKALKNAKYISTAIVLDNRNENIYKALKSFAVNIEQQMSNLAKNLLEKCPPSTKDPKCKYDFVISDGLDKSISIAALGPIEAQNMAEYLDALDMAYRDIFGDYNQESYDIKEFDSIGKASQESMDKEADKIFEKDDFDDIDRA